MCVMLPDCQCNMMARAKASLHGLVSEDAAQMSRSMQVLSSSQRFALRRSLSKREILIGVLA